MFVIISRWTQSIAKFTVDWTLSPNDLYFDKVKRQRKRFGEQKVKEMKKTSQIDWAGNLQ